MRRAAATARRAAGPDAPGQARELLAEFAEFTRYSFRRERTYVTLAAELLVGAWITVSLVTARPKDVSSQMLALHALEGLGLEALEPARA